ncbi:MAG TPA: prepilin-type N-terminal cleavage/methylation domain-containing protein [Chthoniobacteraceae bacterium]|nr:prepilin-type N-terminal cleavage/methylation domain-containing protein [Chthoniobacteraceae bacterium]
MNIHHRFSARHGFTLVELLVAIALIAFLGVLVFSFSGRIRVTSDRMKCTGNLRQIFVLMQAYLDDHNGHFPVAAEELRNAAGEKIGVREFWGGKLVKHSGVSDYRCFVCPALNPAEVHRDLLTSRRGNDFAFAYVSYAINRHGLSPSISDERGGANSRRITEPSKVLMLVDYDSKSQPNLGWHLVSRDVMAAGWEYNAARHGGAVNALFCDGHVELISSLETLKGKSASGAPWFEKQFY